MHDPDQSPVVGHKILVGTLDHGADDPERFFGLVFVQSAAPRNITQVMRWTKFGNSRERFAAWFGGRKAQSPRSLAPDPFNTQAHAVQGLAGGDEERLPVLAAEADIGRPRLVHGDVLDLFAFTVEYGY